MFVVTTPSEEAQLNISAVLRWVRKNIAAFGGDPSRVMVFGQSAGAYDVQPLIVSPMARGLFARAGMESNAIPRGQLPSLSDGEAQDAPYVPFFGCDTAADVLACLRAVPAAALVNARRQLGIFPPMVIEPRVIPVDPFDALEQHGSPVPLLLGSNREEFTSVGDDPTVPLDENGYAAAIHARFDPFGPSVADHVLSLYPAAAYDMPVYALVDVDSHFVITCEMRNVAVAAAGAQRPPIWRYLFTHRLENDASLNALRAFHTAELYFVFGNLPLLGSPYTPSEAEVELSSQMMDYWGTLRRDRESERATPDALATL